jgi:hypothetical protein
VSSKVDVEVDLHMIDQDFIGSSIQYLEWTRGIKFDPGLSDAEVAEVERAYSFTFPPDLRLFLQTALPVSGSFPNWRAGPDSPAGRMTLRERLAWPLEGICYDIEANHFWLDRWGPRPDSLDEACAVARWHVEQAPKLIPLYSHRYLPDMPSAAGNPIFSVYQTDIILYGADLPAYLAAEFGVPNPYPPPDRPRWIRLWSELVEYNGGGYVWDNETDAPDTFHP